ncbi:DUF1289 domain-containing protein [Collimonas sp. NPDC087041]|uniref:DUF1289 domain-containing protein n=1 Tax=Collimonas sp. NPDC087041 TaxID=3363960 RepID=UPI003823FAFC
MKITDIKPVSPVSPLAASVERQVHDDSASPCINVCVMSAASGLCDGCQRTIDEIAAWGSASLEQKRHIWQLIRQRRAAR